VQWGQTYLEAKGLGAYITKVSNMGDFPRLALGIAVMSLFVVVINRTIWRPLYNMAVERFQIR
jgi:NitT/TauT family transport system permease protein